MFKVKKTKTGKIYTVYSVQMIPVQNLAGQGALAGVFLIYDDEKNRWEMADSAEFEPVVDVAEDSKIEIK